jgi:hypothetical protein
VPRSRRNRCPDATGIRTDGVPRTFNAIGVELLDHTADTLAGSPYDLALWRLVDERQLEQTLDAPVLFRLPVDRPA